MEKSGTWTDESSGRFADHRGTVRGYVRYEVTRANLITELGLSQSEPLRIGDIGGGEGYDSEWAAALGHKVVLVEPAAAFTDKIHKRYQSDCNPLNFDIVQATAEQAYKIYKDNPFDVLFSHGVLMYQADPQKRLNELAAMLKPGGYLSLLTSGKLGKINRYKDDQAKLALLLVTGKYINNAGTEAMAYLPQDITGMLNTAGLDDIKWFGVRVNSDHDDRRVDEVPQLHLNRLLRAEMEASRDPNLKPGGQMLHFIATKNT